MRYFIIGYYFNFLPVGQQFGSVPLSAKSFPVKGHLANTLKAKFQTKDIRIVDFEILSVSEVGLADYKQWIKSEFPNIKTYQKHCKKLDSEHNKNL